MSEKTDTKIRLLQTAAELFWQQGYTATGVAQILKAAEAKSGSLYYFFPTKEDLLAGVLEDYLTRLWPEVIQPVFDRVSDPIERIFGILDGYRRGLRMTKCHGGCPIGNLALELSDSHPAVRKLLAANFAAWRDAIRQCLDEAADRLPEGIAREELATFVLSVLEGGVMQARADKRLTPFEQSVAFLRDYFDRLLADGSDWSAPKKAKTARLADR
jgi:TetR/AcrR family transcriptional regulator, transcriptional repressor for nem operon